MAPLVEGLRSMAANSNPAHGHEFRDRGDEFQHDCGWGVAWNEGGRLESRVSALSCVTDPGLTSVAAITTDLAVLHARRTPKRETIAERNCHPFFSERFGETWAFCHNGTVNDVSQLDTHGADPRGDGSGPPIDSELLFHHLMERLDPHDVPGSMSRALGGIADFTCLNSFLVTADAAFVCARVSPDTTRPEYYTLWLGRGEGFALASSEPLQLSSVEWTRVPDGNAFRLEV